MKKRIAINVIAKLMNHLMLVILFMLSVGCSKDKESKGEMILIDEELLSHSMEADETLLTIHFTALTSWDATLKDVSIPADWLTLSKEKGIGGVVQLKIIINRNTDKITRSAKVVLTSGDTKKTIHLTQGGSSLQIMNESDVPDFDKFYKPIEFKNMNMLRSDAKWSWFRHKQSEHFFVFWEAGFGDDPNADHIDASLRVDVDDLLQKAEQFYKTNIEKLNFAKIGEGTSYLDRYKMEIFLFYQEEWLATGSGYDDTIGALWVSPGTCQPVGSTIAHEIGHSFQYQVYCDQILQGAPNDFKRGFRYGYLGSNGGNGFWEQCAQWQSYQDYPEELFANYHFNVWLSHYHRHFEHEWMRYASYWLQYYWTQKHGSEILGEIWRQSVFPEDAIKAYMRLYCNNQWESMITELYDYAARMATFDLDIIRDYANSYLGRYSTKLYLTTDNFYQVAYASCPGTTGFNIIPLKIPDTGVTIVADFQGLEPGAALAENDPGEYMESEMIKGTVKKYNTGSSENKGWRYGFVALQRDGVRIYGKMNNEAVHRSEFTIPTNVEKLFFIVLGAPKQYASHPWDEKELNDSQWPYKVKFQGTDLLGSIEIDPEAKPTDVTFTYSYNCNAATEGYDLGIIDLQSSGAIKKLAQAFVMQPNIISGSTLPIINGQTAKPVEGKIVFGLLQTDGTYSYNYTANTGFYCTKDGDQGSWGNDAPIWIEYDKDLFTFKYGHKPGFSVSGEKYTIKPSLIYTKGGIQYKAVFVINIQF